MELCIDLPGAAETINFSRGTWIEGVCLEWVSHVFSMGREVY
jgi:hypothetical protein